MQRKQLKTFRGDTLVEVMFAVGVFGIIAVSAISLMNRGLNTAQLALETTMARNEIDAQAEALRFIHDAYASEKNNSTKEYADLWGKIISLAIDADDIRGTSFLNDYPANIESCEVDTRSPQTSAYSDGVGIINRKSFIINTHKLDSNTVINNYKINESASANGGILYTFGNTIAPMEPPMTYPRLIFDEQETADLGSSNYFTELSSAEGIWITAVKSEVASMSHPQYYDFYIRTCWNTPGRNNPTTISTTIRLYNPDY